MTLTCRLRTATDRFKENYIDDRHWPVDCEQRQTDLRRIIITTLSCRLRTATDRFKEKYIKDTDLKDFQLHWQFLQSIQHVQSHSVVLQLKRRASLERNNIKSLTKDVSIITNISTFTHESVRLNVCPWKTSQMGRSYGQKRIHWGDFINEQTFLRLTFSTLLDTIRTS